MSQHYRYCSAKKDFEIKNGIVSSDTTLLDPLTSESLLEINLPLVPEIIHVELPTNIPNKERACRKQKK
jgi:hypothetical protein